MKKIAFANGIQLAMLRIGVSLVLLLKVIAEYPYLALMYTSQGVIHGEISRPLQAPNTISLPQLAEWLHITNEVLFLQVIYIVLFAAAILLMAGCFTRIAAAYCFMVTMLLFNGYNLLSFGFDGFVFTLLFYIVLFPMGRFLSVDNILRPHRPAIAAKEVQFYLRVLQIHLCIVYLAAGVSKLRGHEWLDGTAIWQAVNQPQFFTSATPYILRVVSHWWASAALTWITLAVEILFCALIWVPRFKLRFIVLTGAILMHLFIGVVMGLQLFALIMVVFDLSAFGNIYIDMLYKHKNRFAWLKAPLWVMKINGGKGLQYKSAVQR